MDYAEVLKDAWKVIWRYKAIIAFGLLTSLVSIEVFVLEFIDPYALIRPFSGAEVDGRMILSILAVALMLLTAIVTGILSHVGILRGSAQALRGTEPIRFRALFAQSPRYLWRVLGIWLLLGAVYLTAAALPSCFLVAFQFVAFGLGMLCLVPYLLGLIPFSILMRMTMDLTTAAVVIDNISAGNALGRAWHLARRNTGQVAIIGVILTVGYYAAFIILTLPDFLASWSPVAFVSTGGISEASAESVSLGLRLGYFPIHALAQALVQAYVVSAWAVAYIKLTTPLAPPEIAPQTSE